MNTKQGMAPALAAIIALLVIGGGGYAIKKSVDNKEKNKDTVEQVSTDASINANATSTPVTTLQVKLSEQNKSGQSGQAVITQTGTSTVKVVLNLTGKPSGTPQPAHIHVGACPNPGAVKYPLTNVGNGASQTEIPNVTLEQLVSELPLAINVHKSAAEASVYVACGDIMLEAATTTAMEDKDMPKGKETKVTYNSQGFSPKSVTIQKGDTVVFEIKTGKAASIASDPHPMHTGYPEFDQYKSDQRGASTFRFTFDKVGTWQYHDHLNANMTGTVIVTE